MVFIKRVLFLGITFLLLLPQPAFAITDTEVNPCASANAVISTDSGKGFADSLCGLSTTGTGSVIRNVIIAILVVATLLSLFFLIRGGLNWILSGGDKAKVTAARETLVAAIVGLIVTFLAYFILNLVLSLFGLGFNNLVIPNITGKGSTSAPGAAAGGFSCTGGTHVVSPLGGTPTCVAD